MNDADKAIRPARLMRTYRKPHIAMLNGRWVVWHCTRNGRGNALAWRWVMAANHKASERGDPQFFRK